MKNLQVAGFLDNSAVNGDGLRSVVFLSGCHHHCPGCHNLDMQDPAYGENVSTEDILLRIENNMPLITGVTISGGEPFLQAAALLALLKKIKALKLNSWVYTGYTYSEICKNENFKLLLPWIDVLVDGPFQQELLTNDSPYVGSTNQNIIRLTASTGKQ